MSRLPLSLTLCAIALLACTKSPPPGQAPAPPAGFVNRVWQVAASSAVAPGTLYVFLSDGTLVITSPQSTPSFGKWTRTAGELTMIEEGIAYKVDVLTLSESEFRILSHNPGEPVEITLHPAPLH